MSEVYIATGRRKTAVATVKMQKGKGQILVNGRDVEDYFGTLSLQEVALAAITSVNVHKDYDIAVKAAGGGIAGQASAVRHATARALIRINPEFRGKLKELGFLTRDPRSKERKKSGQPGARKRFQFSKR